MALAKEHVGSVQTCSFNGNLMMGDFSSYNAFDEKHKLGVEDGEISNNLDKNSNSNNNNNNNGLMKNLVGMSTTHSSSSLGSPSSGTTSNEFLFHHQEEANSLINFRGEFDNFILHDNGSLLSFEQNNYNFQWNQMNNSKVDPRLAEDINCFQTASSFSSISNSDKENNPGDWLYSEGTLVADQNMQESVTQDAHKRPHMGESMQALKKQCSGPKKPKPTKISPAKDPQSIAAKNRRERISERLKILQELVPNGSKVDLVTMLEKAISYVKFLQLQVKVLATDDFWPVQGGKAPDISQVKEAIDAILSSQKDRNSSSSSKW